MADNIETQVAEIVKTYLATNPVAPELIETTIAAVSKAARAALLGKEPEPELKPAVPIKKSVFPDHIICLEDGKKFKSLKRHLQSHYNLTPDEYRKKWGLSADYPMVAPEYAKTRSELAKTMGLGTKRGEAAPKPVKIGAGKRKALGGK